MKNSFDPENLGLPGYQANEAARGAKAAVPTKAAARHRLPFFTAPVPWIHYVADVLTSPPQFKAVCQMLFLARFDKNRDAPAPVQVTAGKMAEAGVSTYVRDQTLRLLEAAGLVAVKWQSRAGPTVTLRFDQVPVVPYAATLDAALQVVAARQTSWRPADLLAAIERPPEYVGKWPTTVKQLLTMVRQVRPGSVIFRSGHRRVDLG